MLIVCSLFAFASACGRRSTGPRPTKLDQQSTCVTDTDCGSGFACSFGECVPAAGCTRDTDCSPTQYCASGSCQARNDENRSCASHQDCSFGLFCNLATGQCSECLNDDHCDVGAVCRADG